MNFVTAATRTQQYKFQKLEVYQLALEYLDRIYELTKAFPAEEKYNLTSQVQRAATSIVLNIAEDLPAKAIRNKTDSLDSPYDHT